jgi:hypothetical protein
MSERVRIFCALPFAWIALQLLHLAQRFHHIGELIADEPCLCDVFKPGSDA